ncbi:transmembrane protein C1orf162 homolog [Erinaceus europaeus]|uniref:Transmembrane protein C1orf162 homolog n=1 Tax=Erinaceus europaeus TaxID=9365 RepID=A0ABM3Y9X4_ERIEU|nr:transmembrane protein C1orf162 homolog [Erinaceus europaeus]
MGENSSKQEKKIGHSAPSTTAFTITSAPDSPALKESENYLTKHLILAFFVGILLTLLLVLLVFLIIKSYKKYHAQVQALDPQYIDPPAKLSSPEDDTLTYIKISQESSKYVTAKHPADSEPIIYSQIKVSSSPSLFNEA